MFWQLCLFAAPIFGAIFCFTWWMRGKGFGEFLDPFRRGSAEANPGPPKSGSNRPESR